MSAVATEVGESCIADPADDPGLEPPVSSEKHNDLENASEGEEGKEAEDFFEHDVPQSFRPSTTSSSRPATTTSTSLSQLPATRPCTPASSIVSSRPRTSSSTPPSDSKAKKGASYRELKGWLLSHGLEHLRRGMTEYGVWGLQDLVEAPNSTLEKFGARADWSSEDIITLARALHHLRQTRVIHHHHPKTHAQPDTISISSSQSRPLADELLPARPGTSSLRPNTSASSTLRSLSRVSSRPGTVSSVSVNCLGRSLAASGGAAGLSRPGTAASVQHQLRMRRAAEKRELEGSLADDAVGEGASPQHGAQERHVHFLSRLAAPRAAPPNQQYQQQYQQQRQRAAGRMGYHGPSWKQLKAMKAERAREEQWAQDLVLGRVARGK